MKRRTLTTATAAVTSLLLAGSAAGAHVGPAARRVLRRVALTSAKPEPTRANGFPRDFATRTPAARQAGVPSSTKIRTVKEFLLDTGHAD